MQFPMKNEAREDFRCLCDSANKIPKNKCFGSTVMQYVSRVNKTTKLSLKVGIRAYKLLFFSFYNKTFINISSFSLLILQVHD